MNGAGAFVGFYIFFLIFALAIFGFWLFCLIDVIRHDFKSENGKVLWLLIVILLGGLGAIIYFFAGRKDRKLPGKENNEILG